MHLSALHSQPRARALAQRRRLDVHLHCTAYANYRARARSRADESHICRLACIGSNCARSSRPVIDIEIVAQAIARKPTTATDCNRLRPTLQVDLLARLTCSPISLLVHVAPVTVAARSFRSPIFAASVSI